MFFGRTNYLIAILLQMYNCLLYTTNKVFSCLYLWYNREGMRMIFLHSNYRYSLLALAIICCCCKQPATTVAKTQEDASIIIDGSLQDSLARHTQLKSGGYFSVFETPVEVRYLSNDVPVDSLIVKDFRMMSWYSARTDSIDLVAHVGGLETEALLVRFVKGKPHVYFYRAPHSEQHYFKINKTDTFTSQIIVPPAHYRLQLSTIPDTLNKQVVYGHIDMESQPFFDKRDSAGPQKVSMKFYFRSQYRKYKY
jgi:hypothetical protein